MCTSLLYLDAANNAYLGRTLELSVELPYQVSFIPKQVEFTSALAGFAPVSWSARYAYLAITMPDAMPAPGTTLGPNDLKVIEGVNEAGLTFSVQAYPQAGGEDPAPNAAQAMLSAADLGAWVLGQFSNVEDIKAALGELPVFVAPVPILGNLKMPFHYSVHDASGGSIVIEFHYGVRTIYDNPVGVMTNAPPFSWHLTNLDNYTFLTNVDQSKAQFGHYSAIQPGGGIANAGLPSADTSVARFVRAAFYAQYAEKQSDPDRAVEMVAHIMNNFDRPRGITVDPPSQGSSHLHLEGQDLGALPTEFTSWTSLTDLSRKRLYIRGHAGMNYVDIDLPTLAETTTAFRSIAMETLLPKSVDVTAALK